MGIVHDRKGLKHRIAEEGVYDWAREERNDGRWVQFFRKRGSEPSNPITVPFGELTLVTDDDEEYQRLKTEVLELRERNDLLERLFNRVATRDSKGWLGRVLTGELRQVVILHGPVNIQLIPSVVKRVVGKIAAEIDRATHSEETTLIE